MLHTNYIYIYIYIYIYDIMCVYKQGLVLNNLQELICCKDQHIYIYIYIYIHTHTPTYLWKRKREYRYYIVLRQTWLGVISWPKTGCTDTLIFGRITNIYTNNPVTFYRYYAGKKIIWNDFLHNIVYFFHLFIFFFAVSEKEPGFVCFLFWIQYHS